MPKPQLSTSSSTAKNESIFVTNITGNGNIIVTRRGIPNEEDVISVSLENLANITIEIEWDRSSTYEGLPSINGVDVTRTSKAGGTYTGTATIPLVEGNIVVSLGGNTRTVLVESLTKPRCEVSFTGDYPNLQTELKGGDIFEITVTSPDDIVRVEVQQSGACNAQVSPTMVFNSVIRNTSVFTTDEVATVRVMNTAGTWSDWTNTTNTVKCNNLYPAITLKSIYPNGQGALKDNEEVIISKTQFNTDTSVLSVTPDLSLTANGCSRVFGDYQTGIYTITGNRAANDATSVVNQDIRVVNVLPQMVNNTPFKVRSGVGAVILPCLYNQDLLTPVVLPQITATDADLHSNNILNIMVACTNLSGMTTNIQRQYKIIGFAQKTLTLTYPLSNAPIGCNIVDIGNVIIAGIINSTPAYEMFKNRVATPQDIAVVTDFAIVNNNSIEINSELASYLNYNNENDITIRVEEI